MLESASRNYLAHDEVVRGVYVADIQAMLHRRRYIYITYREAPASGSLFYYWLMRQGQEATDTVGFVRSGFCKNNMHIVRKDGNLISNRINIRRITCWQPVEDDFVLIK